MRTAELEYTDFLNLCACLMKDTPLANLVSIRSEDDPKVLEHFTAEQRTIRNEWRNRNKVKNNANMDALFRMALA